MNAETIQFMQHLRAGANPDAVFHNAWEARAQALDHDIAEAAQGAIQRQNDVEAQIAPLVARAAAFNPINPLQQDLETCQRQLTDLQASRLSMEEVLSAKSEELKNQQNELAKLSKKLSHLAQHVSRVPPHGQSFVIDLGQRVVSKIGEK